MVVFSADPVRGPVIGGNGWIVFCRSVPLLVNAAIIVLILHHHKCTHIFFNALKYTSHCPIIIDITTSVGCPMVESCQMKLARDLDRQTVVLFLHEKELWKKFFRAENMWDIKFKPQSW